VVFSSAERSVDSNRERRFDANEIIAFALTFRLPPLWFFLPPGGEVSEGEDPPYVSAMKREELIEDPLAPDELLNLNLFRGQRVLVEEILDRAATYEKGLDLTLVLHSQLPVFFHLREWSRALVAKTLMMEEDIERQRWLEMLSNYAKSLGDLVNAAISELEEK
jgi:hypothetical protein